MVQPVVAGVDGSAESLTAAEWAARDAVRRDQPLCLLHAWNWHPRQQDSESASALSCISRGVICAKRWNGSAPSARTSDCRTSRSRTLRPRPWSRRPSRPNRTARHGIARAERLSPDSTSVRLPRRRARTTRPLVRAGEQAEYEHVPAYDRNPSVRTGYRDVALGIDITEPCDEAIQFAFEAARLRKARPRAVQAWRHPARTAGRPAGDGPERGVIEPSRREPGSWTDFRARSTLEPRQPSLAAPAPEPDRRQGLPTCT